MQPALVEPAAGERGPQKPRWELADIFRQYAAAYLRSRPVCTSHYKVMNAIEVCRTEHLGGHVEQCDVCGFERYAYNSCRNRHCPKCQTLAKADWLEARQAELLPVGYFHEVFTLPHEINPLALANQTVVYRMLFRSVAETLLAFGRDPRHLGGTVGFLSILHTWDQLLHYHVHLHVVIPGGALASDRSRWIPARSHYLFPVKALARTFRGKFIAMLKGAYTKGGLAFPGSLQPLGTPDGFARLIDSLWSKPWVVYSKAPFGGARQVLSYLGRYTHQVAISNHRILGLNDGKVTFAYRDRRDGDKKKTATIDAHEFIRRFLHHVVPKRFTRIRYFGFLGNPCKKGALQRCRELLGQDPTPPAQEEEKSISERMLALAGEDITRCPSCRKGTLRFVRDVPPRLCPTRTNGTPASFYFDSS